jgi:hypothetical protein
VRTIWSSWKKEVGKMKEPTRNILYRVPMDPKKLLVSKGFPFRPLYYCTKKPTVYSQSLSALSNGELTLLESYTIIGALSSVEIHYFAAICTNAKSL